MSSDEPSYREALEIFLEHNDQFQIKDETGFSVEATGFCLCDVCSAFMEFASKHGIGRSTFKKLLDLPE